MIFLAVLPMAGCVERTLTISTTPPGALVYLNDQEIGRTPVTRDFVWYGNYDLTLRKDGYQTIKSTQMVAAPIFQIVPLDLVCELLPFQFIDHKDFTYTLTPMGPTNYEGLMTRAEALKKDVRPSQRPTTQPAKAAR
jgi:PEGA domain